MEQELLYKYFKGTTSEEEERLILDWVDASPENRKAFQKERMLYDIALFTDEKQMNRKDRKARIIPMLRWSARIAAVVIVAISFGFLFKNYQYEKSACQQTITVPAGQRAQITLADGTKVWLNSKSTLTYASNFGRKERNVELDGEAYFEVTRNEEIPFKVHTEELDVKVLGTKFNFRNYKDDLEAKVCLLEGKVALNTREKETILHPDQQALLDKKTGKLSVSDTKAAYSAEWTNDFLYFDEVLLSDIIKELERSYDVKITVADDTLNTIRFYGNFRKREQSIREIMNVLSSTDKMTYTVNGKNIVITLPQ